jgi:hypothetical protein
MMSCAEAARHLSRRADGGPLDASIGAALDAHLNECPDCRDTLAAQRLVADTLRRRPADTVPSQFASTLRQKLDRVDQERSWIDLADWRVWTVRLAPVAAALALAAWLVPAQTGSGPLSLEEWTASVADSSAAALLWSSEATSDTVLEQMLIGNAASGGEARDGR